MNKDYETHPSFGSVTIGRLHGTPRPLFDSDLKHTETVRLTILTADRSRDLNHDWVHASKQLIEIEMSLAQWASVISSQGMGSGTPVTLRYIKGADPIPDPPFEPRIEESIKEVEANTGKLVEGIARALAVLEDAIETKRGVKATRDALRTLKSQVENAKGNQSFAVKSMAEAAEKLVGHAKADIEVAVLNAQRLTGGQASIVAPEVRQQTSIEALYAPNGLEDDSDEDGVVYE